MPALHSPSQHFDNKYWPLHAVSLVKRITRNCVSCRKRNANPCSQKMADLPSARVQAHTHPFTNTGIDYFGPIEVKQGRSNVKSYGVIFTCLSSRAVHLEVAHSLTTDAFLGVFSRFVARRGRPICVYSDNGTNISSGERELRKNLISSTNHVSMLR